MKIVGAGFGRTGTLSVKTALEQLGSGPAFHLMDLALQPEAAAVWLEAAEGKPVDWVEVMDGWEATVDWPGAAFWEEIWEAFPEAKVLLSVRDPATWYRSCRETIFASANTESPQGPFSLMPAIVELNRRLVWEGTFDGRFEDEDHALQVFERHNEKVQDIVPADRLLVYDVKEGWAPLCEFLEVAIPAGPMPHLNNKEMFRAFAGLPPL